MKLSSIFESKEYSIEPSPDGAPNAFVIKTAFGYIDYVHKEDVNEVWWVESKKPGHGSRLIDLMQQNHPADAIAWGVTSSSGAGLADKWHKSHPNIEREDGPHEGQFDPF